MDVLHERMRERHGNNAGLFMQVDFSATPLYGSGARREYFPHIVYDYDLRDALNDMLVKQLFLEERVRQPVVVSVLALREGFDKTNICVICALRASEADILLEQIVGRGLRLMFPEYKSDATIQEAKRQAFDALKNRERPNCSLDFLYIVEHPKFRTFYDDLRRQGYLIASGDSTQTQPTGDLVPVEVMAERVPLRDIAWPLAIHEEAKLPELSTIDVASLPAYRITLDQQRSLLSHLAVTDRHLETDTRAETWMLRDLRRSGTQSDGDHP